jgi:hypothetical protein
LSWCDKLAATPAVGLKLSARYVSGSSLLDALSPLFDTWFEGGKPKFSLERAEAFAIEATSESGFKYVVEPTRLYVDFHHRLRVKPVSGGPPIVELLSKPLPYTTLLPEVCSRVINATELVVGKETRLLEKIGVVTTATVSEEEMPPGIRRFINYVAKPWGHFLNYYQISVSAELDRNENWHDKCVHEIVKPEDPEALVTVKFDWQREFHQPKAINIASLKSLLASAQDCALNYFEELAEGNRFDVELIGKTE